METNQAQPLNPYQMKRAARIERLQNRADALAGKGAAVLSRARQMASVIPFGQPIASNSYRQRDINYRNKVQDTMQRGIDTLKAAADAAARAAAAESNDAISSDDPEAVKLLQEKLAAMRASQERMKNLNKAWRRDGKAGLIACGFTEEQAERMVQQIDKAYSWEKAPFASWEISNLGANIRRVEDRIERLTKQRERAAEVGAQEEQVGAVRIVTDLADNRLRIFFPGKPSAEIRNQLKRSGFKWSPMAGAWQRMPSGPATYEANRIAKLVAAEGAGGAG